MSENTLSDLLDSLGQHRIDEGSVKITGEFLGQGGFGDVTLGELLPPHPQAGMLVAVKMLRTKEENEHTAIILARELRVWAAVEHPHVVPLIGFHLSESKHAAWFLSPYLKYGNIRGYLSQRKSDKPTRIRLLHEATKGIVYLHSQNICHGDIKGGNILVDDDHRARLCDFGLAKIMESAPSGLTTSKGFRGSTRYMSPEVLGVDGESTGRTLRSDIWALACTALEILLDILPYGDTKGEVTVLLRIATGNLPAKLKDLDISAELSLLLIRCWATEYKRPNARACSHALEAILNKQEPLHKEITESPASSAVKREDNNDSKNTPETNEEEDSKILEDRFSSGKNDELMSSPRIIGDKDTSAIGKHHLSYEAMQKVLKELCSCRIDDSDIELSTITFGIDGFADLKFGRLRGPVGHFEKGTPIAVKQLRSSGTLQERRWMVVALAKELRVWAGLRHQHIVALVGFFLSQGLDTAWILSPYMRHGNISAYLQRLQPNFPTRLRLLSETSSGLRYLHEEGVVHGDIKGTNILINDEHQAKLCDFGLAKMLEGFPMEFTTSKGHAGSIPYMAPELFPMTPNAIVVRSGKSDTWAWSCTALEILFDMTPFSHLHGGAGAIIHRIMQGDHPVDMKDFDVPVELEKMLIRCWKKDPATRPDMGECFDRIARILDVEWPTWRSYYAPMAVPPLSTDDTSSSNLVAEASVADQQEDKTPVVKQSVGSSSHNPEPILSPKSDDAATNVTATRDYPEALGLPPLGHPDRHRTLNNIGAALYGQYRQYGGSAAELDTVIELLREAVRLRPKGHPNRDVSLQNLGTALYDRSGKAGNKQDLEEVVDLFDETVQLRPSGHPQRYKSLNSLGFALSTRFNQDKNPEDLDKAIKVYREALVLRPKGDPLREGSLQSLGTALYDKFRLFKDVEAIDEAILLIREQQSLLSPNHPRYADAQAMVDKMVGERSKMGLFKRLRRPQRR